MGLWSFLRGLWPWRSRRRPAPAPATPAAVTPAEILAEPAAGAPEAAAPEIPGLPELLAPQVPPEAAAEPAETPPEPAAAEPGDAPGEPAPAELAPRAEPDEDAEAEADAAAVELAAEEPAAAALAADQLDETDDEDGGWEDEDDDLDAPDPFISGPPVDEAPVDADLEARRAAARAEALCGEQRIYLSMPAGPGSLAEALHELAAEGLVEATFVEEDEAEPHILYRPVAAS